MEKEKRRARVILKELKRLFPQARTALNYSNCLELLIAVILSAQCTDKMVNIVTEKLFKKYKTLSDYLNANQSDFEQDIKSTGFYRAKTKNILSTVRIIKEKFNGRVPGTMEDLVTLPGVARKTANIVLYLCHKRIEGVAVDTHVRRLSRLYGLTKNDDPVKIEKDLMKILPKEEWMDFTFRFINYGRQYCPAIKHDHENCPLVETLLKS